MRGAETILCGKEKCGGGHEYGQSGSQRSYCDDDFIKMITDTDAPLE